MPDTILPTSEVRAELSRITRRFDEGDDEPVFFGSHRRPQAVLLSISAWDRLVEQAEDDLDLALAKHRLSENSAWQGVDALNAALDRAEARAAGRQSE